MKYVSFYLIDVSVKNNSGCSKILDEVLLDDVKRETICIGELQTIKTKKW
jgi:hypothetical protein